MHGIINYTYIKTTFYVNFQYFRFGEVSPVGAHWEGSPCKKGEKCFGGYPRLVAACKDWEKKLPNPIKLNGADNCVGTAHYHIGRHELVTKLLNLFPVDAMVRKCLGFQCVEQKA